MIDILLIKFITTSHSFDFDTFVMSKKIYREVVYAFIDNHNLNLGIRNLGWTLVFKNLDNI